MITKRSKRAQILCLISLLMSFAGILHAQIEPFEGYIGLHLSNSASTDRQPAEVTVTQVSDPAGHACCVIAPPSLIEIYLIEGKLALNAAIAENPPAWFSFDPMPIDSSLEFIAESRSTVAGFSNILTTVSGSVNEDSITAQVTIGAGGGLPSAIPIVYDLRFQPTAEDKWAFTKPSITPTLGIDVPLKPLFAFIPRGISPLQPLDLALTIATGGQTGAADWWLVLASGDEVFSFNLETGKFELGFAPTFQGPLTEVAEPVQLLNGFISPFAPDAPFTIAWGVDTNPNGELDVALLIGNAFNYYIAND